jgi:site-specific DNA recombinase
MRAVIYARYSTEQQSAASIPDQVRLCRRLCEENGWTVVNVFADEAISGATHLRPDFQRMQQSALAGEFDVLVAEALDRLSRDQEHIAGLHKRMRYLGIKIVTKTEGEINELHIGLGGTMSALFLRQLAIKTHRGLEGRIKAQKSAGGISYGYRVVRQTNPDGSISAGDRIIDPDEALIVQRIFAEYDCGRSARAIAVGLNKDCIAPPRSGGKGEGRWSFSTISGNWKRGTGILNNELYVGKLVWNRQRFVKDPETGKRQARLNPSDAWITEDVPHLRIIDETLWKRVKDRQQGVRQIITAERILGYPAPRCEQARRPRYLLSGLLHCGCCGAKQILVSKTRYGCSAARNSGTCSNRKTIERLHVEERVLSGLRDRMLDPEIVGTFILEFQREYQRARTDAAVRLSKAKADANRVQQDIDNLIDAITRGMFHPSMKSKLDHLEAERTRLGELILALSRTEPPSIHPGLAEVYKQKVTGLVLALNSKHAREEVIEILRGLIEKITLNPHEGAPHDHHIEVFGEIGAILRLGNQPVGKKANTRSKAAGDLQVTVVAGAGFEPAAFRL